MFYEFKPVLMAGAVILFLVGPAGAQQGMMHQDYDPMSQMGQMPMMQGGMHHDDEGYGHHHGEGGYGHHWSGQVPMMDPEMMHQGMLMYPGMMMGRGMMEPRLGWPVAVPRALTVEEGREALERLMQQANNPNIQIGMIERVDDKTLRATITTKDGSLVQTLLIDRLSGEMWQTD